MSSKDYLLHCAMAVTLTAAFAAPAPAQTEDIQTRPFMIMSAPVQLSGRPMGIEAKYSYGAPDLLNSPPMKFVQIPTGTRLSVALESPINPKAAIMGAAIQARVSENVSLPDGSVIPRGTLVVGHVNSASGGLEIMFDQMQLSNGTILPISSNVVAGLTEAQAQKKSFARVIPRAMEDAHANGGCVGLFLKSDGAAVPAGQVLQLKLRHPAQVAVNGNVL
jgi:hypothetical protein